LLDYKIYCPSYRRAHTCTTHKFFSPRRFCYVVREEEADQYCAAHPAIEIVPIPRGAVTNVADTRNWILENASRDYLVMVDDDYKSIRSLHQRKLAYLTPEEVHCQIINGFQLALDAGVGLWGINVNGDPKQYSVIRPFQFKSAVLGPFQAVIDRSIRYDVNIPFKEDFDYFLQHMQKYGKVLRIDYLHYDVDHQKLEGGCNVERTLEKERENFILLKQKWGSIVRTNRQTKRASVNPIVRF
jgi:hypothetical protein